MKKTFFIIITLFLSFSTIASDTVYPTLKSVMIGLGKSMDNLNRGIFYEDFKTIEIAASELANHPKPKGQLPVILKTLKGRAKIFKGIDGKVHNSSLDIVKLARKKDMAGILKKHQVVMNNCVACHTQFRKEISKVLSL